MNRFPLNRGIFLCCKVEYFFEIGLFFWGILLYWRSFILVGNMVRKQVLVILMVVFFLWWAGLLFASSFGGLNVESFIMGSWAVVSAQKEEVQLVVGGDIMLSRNIGWLAKQEGYDRTFSGQNFNPLSQFSCYASGDCLLYFNLESMFSAKDNDQPKGGFTFRANTGNIQTLLDLQGNNELVLSLANNHTNNAWGDGVELTRHRLSAHEIGYFGAGNTTWEAEAFYSTRKGWIKFCFQAFSYDWTHWIYGKKSLAWNPLSLPLMTGTLYAMEQDHCEVKVLGLHWWAEYRFQPAKRQVLLAHQLVDAGADILLGGHSHVPWPYEIYNGKPIFYSFGNFLFDQDWGMKTSVGEFDFNYDYELKKNRVPTYIPLLASLQIEKNGTGIQISSPLFKMARLHKGIFSPLDDETFSGVMEHLVLK